MAKIPFDIMKAPDKLYFPEDGLPRYIDWDGSPIRTKQVEDSDICYICKDALLEWAKEKKKQLFEQESENDEPSDVAAGINAGLDMVIGKLNSM